MGIVWPIRNECMVYICNECERKHRDVHNEIHISVPSMRWGPLRFYGPPAEQQLCSMWKIRDITDDCSLIPADLFAHGGLPDLVASRINRVPLLVALSFQQLLAGTHKPSRYILAYIHRTYYVLTFFFPWNLAYVSPRCGKCGMLVILNGNANRRERRSRYKHLNMFIETLHFPIFNRFCARR